MEEKSWNFNNIFLGSAPSSPLMSSFHPKSSSQRSPALSSRSSNSCTPPPPPPPLKDSLLSESKDRSVKYERYNRNNSTSRDSINRSKLHDSRTDETPYKTSNRSCEQTNQKHIDSANDNASDTASFKSNQNRNNSDRLTKKQLKFTVESDIRFLPLPDLDKYIVDFSSTVSDFTASFYGNTLEKQVSLILLY